MQNNATSLKFLCATAMAGLCMIAAVAQAAEPITLHVNTFPTARSLPFYVGVERGFFTRRGLNVALGLPKARSGNATDWPAAKSTSCIPPSTTPSP